MYDAETRARALGLLAEGLSQNAVSKHLDISRAAIRDWACDPRGARGGSRPCPAPATPSPSYAALLGFYLGDGYISRSGRAHALRIFCDATQHRVIADVEETVRAVHANRRTYRVRGQGVIVVQSNWKHWPCLFPQHGPGRKHERVLGMTEWQWASVEAHPAAFLRGLFHSDGCLVNNRIRRPVQGVPKEYVYPRWQFVNASEEILGWCGDALDLADVAWRRSAKRVISVSRRPDVERLTNLIGVKR